jgi:hypothetical protein
VVALTMAALLPTAAAPTAAAPPAGEDGRSVIVQLFEWK